jgi:hypothetical protein
MKNGKGVKVTYMPVTHITPIYPPGYVHPGEAFERSSNEIEKRCSKNEPHVSAGRRSLIT